MADIASLGIRVTTQGAKEAATDLNKLADAGKQAASGVQTASDAAKKAGASFKSPAIREQREELAKLLGQIDPTVAALGRLDAMEQKLGRFRKQGLVDTDTFKDASKKINDSRTALTNFGSSAGKAGKSAKELAFATRGLPAQFTDIAVSLQSGQRPLNILLQQGGQLKDMFGGIGPALRAMGGYVAGLINPFTLAAAAIGVAGIAFAKAEGEVAEFNKAIILTGNYARTSADDLAGMAQELDRATSATAGKSAAVLAEVTATGRFTADQIRLVSEAAINMEDATGKATDATVKDFQRLKDAPLDYILQLNKAGDVNNFLTKSTLEQIQTLVDQGREADAASVAIKAYADTINTRSAEVTQNLTSWGTLWHDLKIGAREAFDEIVQGFRESDDFAKKALASASAFASTFGAVSGLFATAVQGSFAFESARAAQAKNKPNFSNVTHGGDTVVDSDSARERRQAEEDFGRLAISNLSKRERLEKEIADIRALGLKAGKSEAEIEKQVLQARARYAESLPKGRKPRKESDTAIQNAQDRFADMTGRLRAELEGPLQRAEEEHIRRMREIQQAAEKGKIGHDELAAALKLEGEAYNKTTEEIRNNLASQVAAFSGPIAQVQDAHAERLREIDRLQRQLGLSGDVVNAMLAEEAKAFREAEISAARAADPLGALLSDMADELDMIGKSNAERAVMNELRRLGIDLASQEAQAAMASARAFQAEAEARQQQIDLMDDFRSSASNALSDFVTGAKSAKDALKDFFDEMAAQITKAIADNWMKQLFGAQGSDGSGTAGGGWLAALAGLFSGGGGFGGAGSPLARGGVLMDGNLTAFADGGVVSRATRFPMRDGRTGLMGEAGPEAILPLHRGADGKLGVRMAANDDGMPQRLGPATVNQAIYIQGRIDSRTPGQFAQATAQEQNRASARNRA